MISAVSSHSQRALLVTGASGFVGAAVARALIAEGARVRVLLRPTRDPGSYTQLRAHETKANLVCSTLLYHTHNSITNSAICTTDT